MIETLLSNYIKLIRKRPSLFIMATLIVVMFYIFIFHRLGIIDFDFTKPKLVIEVFPTESYDLGQSKLLLKRFSLSNESKESLKKTTVTIRVPHSIESLKVTVRPALRYNLHRFEAPGEQALFEINMESFLSQQRVEFVLYTTNVVPKDATVVIEAVSAYRKGLFVGESVAGNFELPPIEK